MRSSLADAADWLAFLWVCPGFDGSPGCLTAVACTCLDAGLDIKAVASTRAGDSPGAKVAPSSGADSGPTVAPESSDSPPGAKVMPGSSASFGPSVRSSAACAPPSAGNVRSERSGSAPRVRSERSGSAPRVRSERSGSAPRVRSERSGSAPRVRSERSGASGASVASDAICSVSPSSVRSADAGDWRFGPSSMMVPSSRFCGAGRVMRKLPSNEVKVLMLP